MLTKESASASVLIRFHKCVVVALCWDISVSCRKIVDVSRWSLIHVRSSGMIPGLKAVSPFGALSAR